MNATTHLAFIKLAHNHQSPGMAFLAGLLGGPGGAGMYGSRADNGWNSAGQSWGFGRAGKYIGAAAGVGLGMRNGGQLVAKVLGKMPEGVVGGLEAEAKPVMNQIRKFDPALAEKAKRIVAAMKVMKVGGGAVGGIGGMMAGTRIGNGVGAARSTQQHNNLPQTKIEDLFHRLMHKTAFSQAKRNFQRDQLVSGAGSLAGGYAGSKLPSRGLTDKIFEWTTPVSKSFNPRLRANPVIAEAVSMAEREGFEQAQALAKGTLVSSGVIGGGLLAHELAKYYNQNNSGLLYRLTHRK